MKVLIVIALFACATAFRLPPAYKHMQMPQKRPGRWHMQPRFEEEDKIVGGTQAASGEFPCIISLQRSSWWGGYSHICGGSIIKANKVLTAAHCTSGTSASSFQVVAGEHDLSKTEGTEQTASVSSKKEHPDYNSQTTDADFSVLHLSSSFSISSKVGVIACDVKLSHATGEKVIVAGWGTTSEGGSSPNVLQRVDVFVISDSQCNSDYSGSITSNMICAGVSGGGKDSCQGDSGGPLMDASRSTLVGVVSWGQGCARAGYPGVYAKVAAVDTWLSTA